MFSTRIQWRVMLTAVLILGITGISSLVNAAQTVWLMTFTIDNRDDNDLAPYAVAGDGTDPVSAGGAVYRDYRLGTGLVTDVNYCVEASPAASLLFVRLNRKLDGDSGTQYCGLYDGSPRQFVLTIDNAEACAELWSHGYSSGPDASCTFTGLEKPRIRISSDLYATRTSRTPVAFLYQKYDQSLVSYEVRTETDASVVKVGLDPTIRIVSYSGSARLWRFAPGVKARAVAQAFPLPFQMTFKRTAQ